MDQPLVLLFGAGVIIVISAFLLKKAKKPSMDKQPVVHTSFDRTEMETTLKRFVSQVQKENDQTVTYMERNKQELLREIARLSERVQHLEAEVVQLRTLPQAETKPATKEDRQEADTDSLLLKERFKRVFELKQEGLTVDEIAKRLGAGRGEIDLIFSLASPAQRGSADDQS